MQDDGEQISTYAMSYECQDLQSVANDELPLWRNGKRRSSWSSCGGCRRYMPSTSSARRTATADLLIPDTAKAQKLLERAAEQDLDGAVRIGQAVSLRRCRRARFCHGYLLAETLGGQRQRFRRLPVGQGISQRQKCDKKMPKQQCHICGRPLDNANAQLPLGKADPHGRGYSRKTWTLPTNGSRRRDNGHTYAEFFMKRMERGEQEPPSVLLSATRLLYHMGNIFRDNAPAPAANGVQIDRKRLARLRQSASPSSQAGRS